MANRDFSSTVEISPTYYLDNFLALINSVHCRYHGILTDEEQGFRDAFLQLPTNAQCLFVRLVSRKGPLFRVDRLSYTEIDDVEGAIDRLVAAGLVHLNPSVPVSIALNILTLDELRRRFPGLPKSLRKAQLIAAAQEYFLDTASEEEEPLLPAAEVIGREIPLLLISKPELMDVFQLLYFGNTYQDLSEFVLSELGVFNYEDYALEGSATAFRSRQELNALHAAVSFRQAVRQAVEQDPPSLERLDIMPRPGEAYPAAQRVWSKALNELARHREREGQHEAALSLYRAAQYLPSRERIARILYKEQAYEEALLQCEAILQAPWGEQEETCAIRIRDRSLRKLKRPVPAPAKAILREEKLLLDAPGPASVELLGLELLTKTQQGQGHYVENWLFNGIFGLYFWEVIFAPVPDAFYHPFQRGPKDLYAPEFITKRRDLLENKLTQLAREQSWHQVVLRIWREKFGRLNPFVHWGALSEPLLELALQRIPSAHFELVFRRMLKDLRHHCTGFPDLILFGPEGGYELVEIKGPGDRLQDHQRRWLEFFAVHQIPARVVYLERS